MSTRAPNLSNTPVPNAPALTTSARLPTTGRFMGPEQYNVANPPHLDESQRWFVPGLCYSYAKFPMSLIQLMRDNEDHIVNTTTLLLPKPLYLTSNFVLPPDNWHRTVQGLSFAYTMGWLQLLENARFNLNGTMWRMSVKDVLVSDPLSPLRTVKLFYLLPRTEDSKLSIANIINGSTAIIERHHD